MKLLPDSGPLSGSKDIQEGQKPQSLMVSTALGDENPILVTAPYQMPTENTQTTQHMVHDKLSNTSALSDGEPNSPCTF